MDLYLIDHGTDTGKGGDVHHPVGIEVGDADGPDFACFVQVLQGPVSAVVIGEGLVQQHQVQIVRL